MICMMVLVIVFTMIPLSSTSSSFVDDVPKSIPIKYISFLTFVLSEDEWDSFPSHYNPSQTIFNEKRGTKRQIPRFPESRSIDDSFRSAEEHCTRTPWVRPNAANTDISVAFFFRYNHLWCMIRASRIQVFFDVFPCMITLRRKRLRMRRSYTVLSPVRAAARWSCSACRRCRR